MSMNKMKARFAIFLCGLLLFSMMPIFPSSERAWASSGSGTEVDPFMIYTVEQLVQMGKRVNGELDYKQQYFYATAHYKLGGNLDLSQIENWTPIGKNGATFRGFFDGNGYTINGLRNTTDSEIGLFGYVQYPAEIQNVKLRNVQLSGEFRVGGLIAFGDGVIVRDSSVTGTIQGVGFVGGLIGQLFTSSSEPKISNSYTDVQIQVSSSKNVGLYVGGLVGLNMSKGTITQSFAKGTIKEIDGGYSMGGLVGSNDGQITKSFADIELIDGSGETGGLVGKNSGVISNSYAQGSIMGMVKAGFSGGLASSSSGQIKHSYAAVTQSDSLIAGGVNALNLGLIENSYWDTDVSKKSTVAGVNNGTIVASQGLTTTRMKDQSSFQGWDFDHIWTMEADGYPYLKTENLIDFEMEPHQLELMPGESEVVTLTANYSNGVRKPITSMANLTVESASGTTIMEDGKGAFIVTAGESATGFLKVTSEGRSNRFDVMVNSQPVSVEKSSLQAIKSQAAVDDETGAQVLVTVVDASNEPLEDVEVMLYEDTTGTDLGTVITSTDQTTDENGQALFTITSRKAGQASYYAVILGDGLEKRLDETAQLTFIPGSVDKEKSTAELDATSAVADGEERLTLTVTLLDKYENPIPDVSIQIDAPEGGSVVPLTAKTNAAGQSEFLLTSTVAGERSFGIRYADNGDYTLLKTIQARFIQGAFDKENTVVTVSRDTVVADGIDSTELRITLLDANRNALTGQRISVDTGTVSGVIIEEIQNPTDENGETRFRIKSTKAGKIALAVRVDDHTLPAEGAFIGNAEVTFVPGPVSAAESIVYIDKSVIQADGADTAEITVTLVDGQGNPVTNQRISLRQTGSSQITPNETVTDLDGIAHFNIRSNKAEKILYTAAVGDADETAIQLDQTVELSVRSGPIYEGNTTITTDKSVLVADGVDTATITVVVKDEHGNAVSEDDGTLIIYANSQALSVTWSRATPDTYTATVQAPTTTGRVLITSSWTDKGGEKFLPGQQEITIVAGALSVDQTEITVGRNSMIADGTSQAIVTVQVKDRYGNHLEEAGLPEVVEVQTDLGTITPVSYKGNGRYEAILTSSNEVGTALLTVWLDQVKGGDTASVDYTTGPLSLTKTTMKADVTSLPADGKSKGLITVQLMDDYGHLIKRKEGELTLTSTLGDVSASKYVEDGRYEAELISGTVSGKAVITGSLNGQTLLAKLEVDMRRSSGGGGSGGGSGSAPKPETPPQPKPEPEPKPELPEQPTPQDSVYFKSEVVQVAKFVAAIEEKVKEVKQREKRQVFHDVQKHWAKEAINLFTNFDWIKGYSNGDFKPNHNITRAEFATMLSTIFEFNAIETTSIIVLKDINNHWAKTSIEELVQAGIITGYSDGTFKPEQSISREEIVIMISRFVELMDVNDDEVLTGEFSDLSNASAMAVEVIRAAAKAGIINGKGNNLFDPKGSATRAEALTVILNVLNLKRDIRDMLESI